MPWLRRIFEFYINASIHVALAVVCFLLITGVFLNISISENTIFFVFFATVACYNSLKYGAKLKKQKFAVSKKLKLTVLVSLFSALIALILFTALPPKLWSLMGLLLILVLAYVLPVFPRDKNLRSLGIAKVILVALIWTGVTTIMPVYSLSYGIHWDLLIVSLQRFLLVIALIIPFEIRDMHYDPPGIRTLPRRIGVRKTKYLGILLAILMFVLVFLRDEIHEYEIGTRFLFMIVVSAVILKTPAYPSRYYASFWVEAIPIFWFGVLTVLNAVF